MHAYGQGAVSRDVAPTATHNSGTLGCPTRLGSRNLGHARVRRCLPGGRQRYSPDMSKKVLSVPPPADPNQGRAQAEQHSRVICHMGLGGKSYALDFWSRVSEINRVSAKVLPFPPRLPSAEAKKPAKRRAGGRKERASKPNS